MFCLLISGKHGQLTYVRVYQGSIKRGETVYNTRTGKKTRIPRLVQLHSDKMEDVDQVYAGDICAFFGLDCASGDSFVLDKEQTLSMESIFVPEPVISKSIAPVNSKDRDNFAKAIQRFSKEDPTYRVWYDTDSKESIASGMGELHLEIYAQRMEREYGCPVTMGKPKVAFRETLLNKTVYDYWHRKQSGGRGEYARIVGYMEPMPVTENTKIEFKDKTTGTNIPKSFIPGVKKGFMDSCEKGSLAGFKVVGVRMVLLDGASHEVDSSEWAFYQAAQFAFMDVVEDGDWQILEPIMFVEVSAPEEHRNAVMGLMRQRNGIIIDTEQTDGHFTITLEVPLNMMFGFASELRRNTQGKGEFTMEYSKYAPCPPELQNKLVEEYQKSLNDGSGGDGKKKKKN